MRQKTIILLLSLCLLVGCAGTPTPVPLIVTTVPQEPMSTAISGLANPAATFCEAQGGQSDIRRENEGEVGYCVFPGGGECEEWAFYRGECTPPKPVCLDLVDEMRQKLQVAIKVTEQTVFQDPIGGQNLEGCQVSASGTGTNFASVDAVTQIINALFLSRHWQADINYDAGGPNGAFGGYRQDKALCLWTVQWEPAPGVQCPADQPISACELTPEQKLYTITVNCVSESK